MLRKPIALILLFCNSILFFSCDGFNKILKSSDYNFKLKKANAYYEAKKYNKAQILYQDLMGSFKATDQYEFIFYRFAYCSYYLGDNFTAQNLFKEYLTKFPQNEKVEEVDYMHALSYYLESPNFNLDQSTTLKAMNLMQVFLGTYPNSNKSKDAINVIDKCKAKLELKAYSAAELYQNAEQYKAASIYFNQLLQDFPESAKAEQYKIASIKNLYQYASYSIEEKQIERFKKVLDDYEDFLNRFPESKYIAELTKITSLTEQKIKQLQQNEYFTKSR